MRLYLKRALAFLIDYLLVLCYIAVLTGCSLLFWTQFKGSVPAVPSPLAGQLIGLATLTIPVFLYFYLSERGRYRGTIGKRRMKIRVITSDNSGPRADPVLIRNLLKFLPWELAHTSVHWIMFYNRTDTAPGIWVWIIAVLPQLLVLLYLVSIYISGGHSSLYDRAAGTRVSSA